MPTLTSTVNTVRDYSEFSLDERLDACANVVEDTELGDAITACVNAGYALNSINEPELSLTLCVIAEKLCENVFENCIDFEENTIEVIKYFTGINYQSKKADTSVEQGRISAISELVKTFSKEEIRALKTILEKY